MYVVQRDCIPGCWGTVWFFVWACSASNQRSGRTCSACVRRARHGPLAPWIQLFSLGSTFRLHDFAIQMSNKRLAPKTRLCCSKTIGTCSAGVKYTWHGCLSFKMVPTFSPIHLFDCMKVVVRNTSDERTHEVDSAFQRYEIFLRTSMYVCSVKSLGGTFLFTVLGFFCLITCLQYRAKV